jgi:hypothetical protein
MVAEEGMDPLRICRIHQAPKGGNSLLSNIVVDTPKRALYVGKLCRKGVDEVRGGAADKACTYSINKAHELLGPNNKNDTRQLQVIWGGQSPEDP